MPRKKENKARDFTEKTSFFNLLKKATNPTKRALKEGRKGGRK